MSDTKGPQSDAVEFHKIRVAHLFEGARSRYKSAAEIALLGLRSALLANGGALAVVLAYLGSKDEPANLEASIALFVAGFFVALLALLFAYLAQSYYGRQEDGGAEKIYFSQIGDAINAAEFEKQENHEFKVGRRMEWTAIVFFLAAVFAFLVGAVSGLLVLN